MSGNLKLCQVSVSKVGTKDLLFRLFFCKKENKLRQFFVRLWFGKFIWLFAKPQTVAKPSQASLVQNHIRRKNIKVFMMRFSFIYLLVYQHLHRNLFASVWISYITSLSQKLLISLKNCSKSCTFFGPWKNDSCKIHFSNTD